LCWIPSNFVYGRHLRDKKVVGVLCVFRAPLHLDAQPGTYTTLRRDWVCACYCDKSVALHPDALPVMEFSMGNVVCVLAPKLCWHKSPLHWLNSLHESNGLHCSSMVSLMVHMNTAGWWSSKTIWSNVSWWTMCIVFSTKRGWSQFAKKTACLTELICVVTLHAISATQMPYYSGPVGFVPLSSCGVKSRPQTEPHGMLITYAYQAYPSNVFTSSSQFKIRYLAYVPQSEQNPGDLPLKYHNLISKSGVACNATTWFQNSVLATFFCHSSSGLVLSLTIVYIHSLKLVANS
jgi:hypothetical protein